MVNQLQPGPLLGGQLGQALGQGLQRGLEQGGQVQFQRNLIQNALEQAKKEIFAPPKQLLDAQGKPRIDEQGKPVYESPSPNDYLNKVFAIMKATAGIPGSERYLGQLFDILSRQQGAKTFADYNPRAELTSDQPPTAQDSIPQDIKPQDSEPQNIVKLPPATKEEFLQRFAETAAPAGLEKAFEEKPISMNLPNLNYASNTAGFFRRGLTAEEKQAYRGIRKLEGADESLINSELEAKDQQDVYKLANSLEKQGITGQDQDMFINLANSNFPNVKSAEEAYRRTQPLFMQYKNYFGQIDEMYKPSTGQSFLELVANTGIGLPSLLAGPAGVVANFIYDKLKDGKDKKSDVAKYLEGKSSYEDLLEKLSTIARPTIGTPYESAMRQKITSFLNGLTPGEKSPETTTTSWDIETVFNPLTKKALAKTRVFIPKNLAKMSDEEQIDAVSDYLTKHADKDDSLVLLRQEFVDKGANWENFYEGFRKAQQQKKPYEVGEKNLKNIATIGNPPRDTLLSAFRTQDVTPIIRGQK